jgi:Tol biopolymer transport system component
MGVTAGTRLGPYEIVAPLGAGGMGEVYSAKDTRLERTVAVKVLPAHLSNNPDLRARFEREARTVSSLNHPHICTLHDVGSEGGVDYLVMEHLEGETLEDRLKNGPLPLEQALRHGIEIADALDKAHRQGVIHRDLKPGNIMLTKAGAKLLDFGLAKTTATAATDALSSLPTQERPLTEAGTLLGTFQYMAPEQLEGREADARTDVFAFGSVLYEMVTGKRAFQGESRASLISAIMSSQPVPIPAVQPMTPPALERLVRTCLAKDPEDRWQNAHDVMAELRWIAEGGSQVGVPAPVAARRRGRERWAWTLAAVLCVAALAAAAWALLGRRTAPVAATRFVVGVPGQLTSVTWPRISPDGRSLAFLGTDAGGKGQIWLRPLGTLEPYPLAGTEGAARPFWSPDSRYLAFFVGNQLKKIAVSGGPPQLICEAEGSDGSWGKGDVILFDGGRADTIRKVSASGGVAATATVADKSRGEVGHGWPVFLPDGRHFLLVGIGEKGAYSLKVGSLDKTDTTFVDAIESRAEYAPGGQVLSVSQGTLVARPFSLDKLAFTGDPVPVAEKVASQSDLAHFSVSETGVLAYMPGEGVLNSQLVWVDPSGEETGKVGQPGAYRDFALSPDGTRLAVGIFDPRTNADDLWIYDLKRDVASRLTFEPTYEIWPVWSPDGSRIVYASDREGSFELHQRLASGAGEQEVLYKDEGLNVGPSDWSRDGRYIAAVRIAAGGRPDIVVIPTEGDGKAIVFLATPFSELRPAFSPDGHWIAYQSDESGRDEVYVQAFPPAGGKWQVSTAGGRLPRWRDDGKEILFHSEGDILWSVAVTTSGSRFEAGIPKRLFQRTLDWSGFRRNRWAATGDGKRFLLNTSTGSAKPSGFDVVLDWPSDLGRK